MKILIVEDNLGIRRILRRVVDPIAAQVCECENGAQALTAYDQCLPDLVLMDIRMPGMDGLAATRQIRARHPRARVIMVTDYDEDDLRAAASESGACGYVLKQNLTALEHLIRDEFSGK